MDLTEPSIRGRIKRIKNAFDLIKATNPIRYYKAVNVVCINQGVSRDKAREYIDILIDANYIKRNNTELTVKKGVNYNGKS